MSDVPIPPGSGPAWTELRDRVQRDATELERVRSDRVIRDRLDHRYLVAHARYSVNPADPTLIAAYNSARDALIAWDDRHVVEP